MGVKSTVFLTREQAENRFVEAYVKLHTSEFSLRVTARQLVKVMSDVTLEEELEEIEDENHGGECYENYIIGDRS